MIESLELIDRKILLFINGLHADWLDPIMWAISSNWFWIPMVALFIFMAVKRFGKWCWIPILAATLCFATTDVVSHNVKESVQRYRPTHNLERNVRILFRSRRQQLRACANHNAFHPQEMVHNNRTMLGYNRLIFTNVPRSPLPCRHICRILLWNLGGSGIFHCDKGDCKKIKKT